MDKYNIIEPKNSIAELDLEMNQWLQLPTDFKFRSNDDCIRLHGCTVPEYYNRLKFALMNVEDIKGAMSSDSNLIKEEINLYADYDKKMKQTLQVMNNPYIVIVTPGDNDFCDTYNNYLNLTSKNRRLSDYYSEEIWGINVRNMYDILKAKETTDRDSTNTASNLRLVPNIESVVDAIYDKWNKATLEHNQSEIDRINNIIENATDGLPRSRQCLITEFIKHKLDDSDPDKLYLPRYCPWFTLEEMQYIPIKPTLYNAKDNNWYRNIVMEEYSRGNIDALLNLGWNPNIEPNEKSFAKAKERQAEFINRKFEIDNHNDIRINMDDDRIDIAFPTNTSKLYTPWFNNKGTFLGYSQRDNIYTYKDMIPVKLDPELYKNLEKKCKQMECPDKSEYNYTSGLEYVILNPVNPLDLDCKQVMEACIVDTLYNLATMGLNKYQIAYPSITF